MYYIKNALSPKFGVLGFLFAFLAMPAVFFSGNITQTNSAAQILGNTNYKTALGIIFAILTFLVCTGGIKRIGNVTEKMVPIMSAVYTVLALGIIIYNIDFLPSAFKMIIEGAFSPKAVTGGAAGSVLNTIISGASRGIFSNEAGLGTSAMAHSCAVDADADTQGLFGVFEVFVDTVVMCTLTALMLLCSRVSIGYGTTESSVIVGKAMEQCFGSFGFVLLSIMMSIFAFSSVVGWAVYGSICSRYLIGKKSEKPFYLLYSLTCIAGAVMNVDIAWRLSAFFNGIMLCINVCALLLLADKIFIKESLYERKNRKAS